MAPRIFAVLRIAPLGTEGIRAGTWRREYAQQKGSRCTQADCLIAAAAVSVGAGLVTANLTDFPMPELIVERRPSGDE